MKSFGSDIPACLRLALFLCACLLAFPLAAQEADSAACRVDSAACGAVLAPAVEDSTAGGAVVRDSLPRYVRHADFMRALWDRLVPQYLKVQYAGSIGLVSIGTGWDYGRHDRWETDLLVGFTPKYEDMRIKVTLTLRQQFTPWSLPLKRAPRWSVEPLTCGLFMSTTLDNRFWTQEPGRYPNSYYNFSTKVRFNLFLGQQVTVSLANRKALHRAVSFYYQLSISELNLVSAWGNSYLRPSDYLSLAFGLKFHLLD